MGWRATSLVPTGRVHKPVAVWESLRGPAGTGCAVLHGWGWLGVGRLGMALISHRVSFSHPSLGWPVHVLRAAARVQNKKTAICKWFFQTFAYVKFAKHLLADISHGGGVRGGVDTGKYENSRPLLKSLTRLVHWGCILCSLWSTMLQIYIFSPWC